MVRGILRLYTGGREKQNAKNKKSSLHAWLMNLKNPTKGF
jgi:hypothetical protein